MYFNSHPRVGGDVALQTRFQDSEISIRTPAWGVTIVADRMIRLIDFNSHPRVGGDHIRNRDLLACKFQFAPPRGG